MTTHDRLQNLAKRFDALAAVLEVYALKPEAFAEMKGQHALVAMCDHMDRLIVQFRGALDKFQAKWYH